MQTVTIYPSQCRGVVTIAPSKSFMQRVCAAALLHHGTTIIHHPGKSNDDLAALNIIQQLGATLIHQQQTIEIKSNGIKPIASVIDCSESGLSARMFASIVALYNETFQLTGKGSLLKRPLSWFYEVLPKLGVTVHSENGHLPLSIKGPLLPKNFEVDGSSSSQYITGLLMAYSFAIEKDKTIKVGEMITIKVHQLNSKPYVDLTLKVMQDFGMLVPENNNYQQFIFTKQPNNNNNNHQSTNITIEGDWSGAAFFLVAASIHGNITVKGLQPTSLQADKKIIEVLKTIGANFHVVNNDYIFSSSQTLNSFNVDAIDCPDLFPPLVALACFCNGVSIIKGIHRLTHKESNRAKSLQIEFKKLGVDIELKEDSMFIHPTQQIQSATISSHQDHRIAMAAAIVATKANTEIIIEEADAVNKSYPSFYQDLKNLGTKIKD